MISNFLMDVVALLLLCLTSAAVAALIGGLCGLVAHWSYSSGAWIADQVLHPARA